MEMRKANPEEMKKIKLLLKSVIRRRESIEKVSCVMRTLNSFMRTLERTLRPGRESRRCQNWRELTRL